MSSIIPNVTKLSSRIIRILGCNSGKMTLQGTNTYLIGTGKRRILLDAGEPNIVKYQNILQEVLKNENVEIEKIVVTHWHHDHVGGVPDVQKIAQGCAVYKYPGDKDTIKYNVLKDNEIVTTEGATLRVCHTPGHTVDHIIMILEEESAVFSGDCILGEGTAVFETLYDYMKSLKKILEIKPKTIYPGHGPVIDDPIPKIEHYIRHRNQREQQILQTVNGKPDTIFSELDIVKIIYTETPVELHLAAAHNVQHHLNKLLTEGKVQRNGDLWCSTQKSSL